VLGAGLRSEHAAAQMCPKKATTQQSLVTSSQEHPIAKRQPGAWLQAPMEF